MHTCRAARTLKYIKKIKGTTNKNSDFIGTCEQNFKDTNPMIGSPGRKEHLLAQILVCNKDFNFEDNLISTASFSPNFAFFGDSQVYTLLFVSSEFISVLQVFTSRQLESGQCFRRSHTQGNQHRKVNYCEAVIFFTIF